MINGLRENLKISHRNILPTKKVWIKTLAMMSSLLLFLLLKGTKAETSNFFEVTYEFASPHITKSGRYDSVKIDGLDRFAKPGLPVLPYKTAKVLLPFNEKVTKVEILCADKITLPGSYMIEPGRKPVPLSFSGPVEPAPPAAEVYQSSNVYPEKKHSKWSLACKNGYKFIMLNLYPVEYLPLDGCISYYPRIIARIHTTNIAQLTRASKYLPAGRRSSAWARKHIKKIIDNPEQINSYPSLTEHSPIISQPGDTSIPGLSEFGHSLLEPGDYEYVIITNEELANAGSIYTFQDLAAHKTIKGIPATIVTTEWIYSNYDGTRPDGGEDNQTKIRNFIIDAYMNWDTKYVLLGGDGDGSDVGGESGDNIIPARGFTDNGIEGEMNIASDMYYACLDGSFDYDGDGEYGEPTDGPGGGEVDLFAEVYVGRAPVDSEEEVSNFVRKTLAYENSLPQSADLKKALILGEDLDWNVWGCDYKDEVRSGSCNYGYCTIGFPEDWDITSLCDRDDPWDKNDLIPLLNNGTHLINHMGHANVGYVMKLVNSDVDNLTNNQYFLAFSQGCYCGSFDNRTTSQNSYSDNDCIAEHLVTEASGAFAVIMNSRYGWGDKYSTDGPSQYFDREFFDAYFGEEIVHLGIINQDAKEDCAGYVSEDLYGRWCCYAITLFGDPQIVIGGLPVGSTGYISLDKEIYAPGGDIHIYVSDTDLNTSPMTIEQYNQIITITTTGGDAESNIPLIETGMDSGIFTGTIPITVNEIIQEDGTLQILCPDTDTITAAYYDADDGTGTPAIPSDTAQTDCLPPTITNVKKTFSEMTRAIITWDTEEPANGCVYYGTTLPLEFVKCDFGLVTSHHITLIGLSPDITYYFAVSSTDEAGNKTINDNNGEYYTFKLVTEVIFEDHVEMGSNGWVSTGFWHQVSDSASPCPESYSPDHSWWYGQDSICNYDNSRANSGSLISPQIELIGENPVLSFMSWEETDGYQDIRRVFITNDSGTSWAQIYQSTNNDADWYYAGPIDLSSYAGNKVHLKFHFDSVNNIQNNYRGWYVDDIAISYIADCSDGRLRLNKRRYDCADVIEIRLADCDLNMTPNAIDTAVIEITSASEVAPEVLTLTETGLNIGIFEGTIDLDIGEPVPDGKLQVTEGDEITAIYDDISQAESKIFTSIIDCSPPEITNIEVTDISYTSANIVWETDETADSLVYYGITLPPEESNGECFFVIDHAMELDGLLPDTQYYFAVASMDDAGHEIMDDNYGTFYTFRTNACILDLLPISPTPGFGIPPDSHTIIRALVQVCEEPCIDATVIATFSNDTPSLQLYDNGVYPDLIPYDGEYTGCWTPHVLDDVTLTITASAPGYEPVYDQINGTVAHLEANFSADPCCGSPPLTIQFTDASEGEPGIESWLWDFGDGTSSTEQNPSHTYESSGTYDVFLTVAYKNVWIRRNMSNYIRVVTPLDPPVISYITPDQGDNDGTTQITINGCNFLDTPRVSLYGGGPYLLGSCDTPMNAYDVHVSGNYACVADFYSGLKIIDITDPANPSIKGSCETHGDVYAVFVSGNYAYLALDTSSIQVIDITDTTHPYMVGSCDTYGYTYYGVYVSGNYAYGAFLASEGSGLQVIDITNPANPYVISSCNTPGYARNVYVSGKYAYMTVEGAGLQIININDPAHPFIAGSCDTPGWAWGLYVSGEYAYIADEGTGLQIINITDPAHPSIAGSCDTPGWARGVYVSGNYAYVVDEGSYSTDEGSGLLVLDITDPAHPHMVGSCDTPGYSAREVFISGNNAYVADGHLGLQVFDVTEPVNPSIISSCDTPGEAHGIHVSGNYAYMAERYSGLQIIDINDIANPFTVGSCDTPGWAHNVHSLGNYAYVAAGSPGLQIIDIADPAHPSIVGTWNTPGSARDVYVSRNYAYVADEDSGLQVIKITEPTNPSKAGSCDTPGNARGVYITGHYAYVAAGGSGLQIIDITDPAHPSISGSCDTPGNACDVYISGDYAYLADGGSGLQVIKITEPDLPAIAGSCDMPGIARSINVYGNYAYITTGDSGIHVIDLSDPVNPCIVGSCETPGIARDVYVSENHVFVADGDSGLRVIEGFVPFIDISWSNWSEIKATIPSGHPPGTHNLHIINPGGQREIMDNAFKVIGIPLTAQFTAEPTAGAKPLTVQFIDLSTGIITDWYWDFGDGQTGTEQNPSHTYADAGDFSVSLIVTGPDGSDTRIEENHIHVSELPPILDSISPSIGAYSNLIHGYGDNFGNQQEGLEPDPYYGYRSYKSIVTFTYINTGETWISTVYPSWSNTHIKTNFMDLFKDKNQNFIQDQDEPTFSGDESKTRLGDYEMRAATVYFGDEDYSGNLSAGDPIFEVATSESQIFTLTDWPIIYKLIPKSCEPADIIKIIGYNFGNIQGDSIIHIGNKTFNSSSSRIKLWSDTKLRVRIPNYTCEWFNGEDLRKRQIWVTVGGIDSNKKRLKVIKPISCP